MHHHLESNALPEADPRNIGKALILPICQIMANPVHMVKSHIGLWQGYLTLWTNFSQRLLGQDTAPIIEPVADDRRFQDDSWTENQILDFLKQSYLLTSRWVQSYVSEIEGLDKDTVRKVDFYARQFVAALSLSNLAMTNPEVLRTTLETGGENLFKGIENLLQDPEEGDGKMNIQMVDPEAFEVGIDVAAAPDTNIIMMTVD